MNENRETTAAVAVVTGAARGIGVEITRQLAAAGYIVYLGARDLHDGQRVAKEVSGDVRPVHLDVEDAGLIAAAARCLEQDVGRVDVLINNAAINTDLGPEGIKPPDTVTAEELRATFETNVVGLAGTTNALLPLLRRSTAARIVNVSSAIASLTLMGDPTSRAANRRLLAYSASKAAVNALTLLYANELRDDGILVNAADPGFVATDMNGHQGTLTPAQGAQVSVRLATLPPDGPTGTFVDVEGHTVPW